MSVMSVIAGVRVRAERVSAPQPKAERPARGGSSDEALRTSVSIVGTDLRFSLTKSFDQASWREIVRSFSTNARNDDRASNSTFAYFPGTSARDFEELPADGERRT
jgi:hypothetical protein